ncbi:MOSC domain-containing protein [Acidobacteriota bacterium]
MVKVVSVNTSQKKGTSKNSVEEAELKINHGLVGDAHAGPGLRQVSLLAVESYEKLKNKGYKKICLGNGTFGENITTEGITLYKLPLGTLLRIGDVHLEVSKIGKECFTPCEIKKRAGICVLPLEGIFAVVKKGGKIHPGDIILN